MRYIGLSLSKLVKYRLDTSLGVLSYYRTQMMPKRVLLNKTKKLKNKYKNKSAFVFGNGPSMNIINPNKVKKYQNKGYHVIAVNSFLYSDMGKVVVPDFQVFSDPLDFVEVSKDHPRAERARTGKIDKQKAIDQGITLFVPIHFSGLHNDKNTYYFCDVENLFSNNVSDILKPRGYTTWTGMKALAIACYLGYQNIYICGMDYDMFKNIQINKNNEINIEIAHFYKSRKRPNYIELQSKKRSKGKRTLGEFLYATSFIFTQHEKFTDHPIINLNEKSLLDAFSKKHNLNIYYD